ncbi:hypothetical protein HN018_25680 (plasmid) [Lichenicola cladoniae]|uniref:Uncharacterized protein n=1 Tax=Lichenicola cladoniae TaxID=1484109 RepID=A0A6M8HYW3_9PROT|nr:hypothetical protein [Lichenicola cladoniae]NPD66760.1 hypothetical protein [Acetobacteraceae bacterium]QKE93538.1 hypothetical protein HN018_25680 [Lichenicola cladoniae]
MQRLQTTGQSMLQTDLECSMVTLEGQRAPRVEVAGQSSLFGGDGPAGTEDRLRRPVQESFGFVRPEPTIALTSRATVPMHRWLQRRSAEPARPSRRSPPTL